MDFKAAEVLKSDYSQGVIAVPFEYGPKNMLLVAETMRILDMDMAGLDYLYDDEVG